MKYKEINIGKHNNLDNGEMKIVDVEGNEILLCRHENKFYALGSKCPHYGASLDEGVLHDGHIICPWHHAAFEVKTGNLLEPPSRDCLTKFELEVIKDEIIVKIPADFSTSRKCSMADFNPEKDNRTFVILGAGAAGASAAETLRREGFNGRIILVSHERKLPYDRPNLSKEYMQGKAKDEWMPLRDEQFYRSNSIELMLGVEIKSAGIHEKTIRFTDREPINYDRLLLATGSKPNILKIPGTELRNIFTLRSFDDCDAIIETFESVKSATVIGASFIGMEVANSLRERGIPVTVVAPESEPFEYSLDKKVGEIIREAHENNGVSFKLGSTVKEFKGDYNVQKAVLDSGEELVTDLVIVGIGVRPVTEYIDGLATEDDGSLFVNEYFKAGDDVYAAGDIAKFRDWRTGEKMRIEHWRTAEQQGMYAAKNMLGKDVKYQSVPFFWSVQAGLHLGYVGHAPEWEEVILHRSSGEMKFIAYYLKHNRLYAAVANGFDRQLDIIEELMKKGREPSADEVKSGTLDWKSLLNNVS
ncbi:MAG: Rieske 2Fe-2S domain-containing protein [candidate division Zixibacteria bacterium]|nr:Rieske 2Fe-2S domain-containing protein [candidate division Zixibacteria bacterium]